MTVVADASLALKWVVSEVDSDTARALRLRWEEREEPLIAPSIFRSEVTNRLHRMTRRRQLMTDEAKEALSILLPSVSIREPKGLYYQALAIARQLGMGATYDALYVALAEAEGCELWTADRKLARAARPVFPQVRWVGEVKGPS